MKYLTLTLLFIIGLCCIAVFYLFFVPGSDLFGITYISKSEVLDSLSYEITGVTKIIVKCNSYDVNIEKTKTNSSYLKVYSKSFGFGLKQNSVAQLKANLDSGILTYEITEPQGLISKNDSVITLYLPADSSNVDLQFDNNSSKINVNDEISVDEIIYNSNSGGLNLNSGSILGDLSITSDNADIDISEYYVVDTETDLHLSLSKGKFNAPYTKFKNVNIISNERAVIVLKECENLQGNNLTAGGKLEIENLGGVDFSSTDTNLKIKNLIGLGSIDLTMSGKVEIENTLFNPTIKTNSGTIKIENAFNSLLLESKSGNITVNKATLHVKATTENGKIYINFDNETLTNEPYQSNVLSADAEIKIVNGSANIIGADNINLVIDGSGHADVNMKDIKQDNDIQVKNGSLNLVVNKDSLYTLTTHITGNGNINVNLSQLPIGGYNGKAFNTIEVNSNEYDSNDYISGTNNLSVTATDGDINILDTALTA